MGKSICFQQQEQQTGAGNLSRPAWLEHWEQRDGAGDGVGQLVGTQLCMATHQEFKHNSAVENNMTLYF